MQVLHYADFIFSNESEAAVFAETHGWDVRLFFFFVIFL